MIDRDIIATVRRLLAANGRLGDKAATLADTQDLAAAGLTSFASVQLMLGLEEAFDIEFPERMLNRRTFATIGAIAAALRELMPQEVAA
jgi:acyl carrier protein